MSGKITATADGGDKIGAFLVYLTKPKLHEGSTVSYLESRGIIQIDGDTVKPLAGLLDAEGNRIGQFVANVEEDKFFAVQTDKGAQEDFVARFSFPDNFSTNEQPFHLKISAMSVGGGGTEAEYVDGNIDLLPTMEITVTSVNDLPNITLGSLSLGEGEVQIFTTDVINVSDVEGDSISIGFGGNPIDFTTGLFLRGWQLIDY